MEPTTEVSGEHAASSATGSPNSIIDRKRELKAIPGSFSYNLGRRSSGPAPRFDLCLGHNPSRSVKSIVAWIESSAATKRSSSRLSASDDGAAPMRSHASSYKLHGDSPSRRPREYSTGGVNVDSDCPTFLDYQQYFARDSLARCLDEQPLHTAMPDKASLENGTGVGEEAVRCEERRRNASDAGDESALAETRSPAEVAAL
ncbi:hypothetical protein MY11210_004212 [Beauveria gryllotalpidicola]